MKQAALLLAALTLSASALANPPSSTGSTVNAKAGPFTGTIDIKVSAPNGGSGTARFHVSKDLVASEVDMGGDTKSLMRLKQRTLIKDGVFLMIDDATKSYREISVEALRAAARRPASETWKIKNIGKETVAGYAANHVVAVSSEGAQLELWTTKGIANDAKFEQAFLEQAKLSPGLVDALDRNGVGGVPVKMLTATPAGPVGMEVTSVKRGAPPAILFAVPDGYARVAN